MVSHERIIFVEEAMGPSSVQAKSFGSRISLLTLWALVLSELCVAPNGGGSSVHQHTFQTELWSFKQELIQFLPG